MLAAPYQLTGILKGTGTINGAVVTVLSGTQLAPSSGTLTFSNGLTLNQGAILTVNSGPGYTTPSINVSGGFLTGNAGPGGITLNVADVFGMAVGTYDFITAATTPSVDPAEFAIGTAPAGYVYGVSLDGSSLALVVSAIPEPVTFGAWAGAALLVLAGYRRWRAVGPRQS